MIEHNVNFIRRTERPHGLNSKVADVTHRSLLSETFYEKSEGPDHRGMDIKLTWGERRWLPEHVKAFDDRLFLCREASHSHSCHSHPS